MRAGLDLLQLPGVGLQNAQQLVALVLVHALDKEDFGLELELFCLAKDKTSVTFLNTSPNSRPRLWMLSPRPQQQPCFCPSLTSTPGTVGDMQDFWDDKLKLTNSAGSHLDPKRT